jgi:hypothetical protein
MAQNSDQFIQVTTSLPELIPPAQPAPRFLQKFEPRQKRVQISSASLLAGAHDGHIDCTLVYRSMYIKAFAKAMLSKTTVLRLSSSQWCSISLRGPRPFEGHPHIHLSLRRLITSAEDVVSLDCDLQYCVPAHSPQSSANPFDDSCLPPPAILLFIYSQSPRLSCVGESSA